MLAVFIFIANNFGNAPVLDITNKKVDSFYRKFVLKADSFALRHDAFSKQVAKA